MAAIQSVLAPGAAEEIAEGLAQALSETCVETMKAQNFHWNVTGMAFGPLHQLFQQMYEDHFQAQDDIAERIRALDVHVDGRLDGFLKRSAVKESDGKLSDKDMIAQLVADQETISTTLRDVAVLAEKHGDLVTNDLAISRAGVHDKFAWLLRSHIA